MFKPGFWIHSEILTHLRILWSQRIGVLSRFWARILDFGFWLFGSSDRGSQHSPGNLAFSLLCDGCHAVEKMTRYNNALKHDGSVRPWFTEVSYCSVLSRVAMATSLLFFSRIYRILFRYRRWLHKYFVDSHPQRSLKHNITQGNYNNWSRFESNAANNFRIRI